MPPTTPTSPATEATMPRATTWRRTAGRRHAAWWQAAGGLAGGKPSHDDHGSLRTQRPDPHTRTYTTTRTYTRVTSQQSCPLDSPAPMPLSSDPPRERDRLHPAVIDGHPGLEGSVVHPAMMMTAQRDRVLEVSATAGTPRREVMELAPGIGTVAADRCAFVIDSRQHRALVVAEETLTAPQVDRH